MKSTMKTLAVAAAALAVSAAPAAAAPGSPGKAECEIFGTPVTGGACIKFERSGGLNGSAYTQNCRLLVSEVFGSYPFTFYAEGGPFPPTTVRNQGECKAALRFFHSQSPG
jgi:hypothetical protein